MRGIDSTKEFFLENIYMPQQGPIYTYIRYKLIFSKSKKNILKIYLLPIHSLPGYTSKNWTFKYPSRHFEVLGRGEGIRSTYLLFTWHTCKPSKAIRKGGTPRLFTLDLEKMPWRHLRDNFRHTAWEGLVWREKFRSDSFQDIENGLLNYSKVFWNLQVPENNTKEW